MCSSSKEEMVTMSKKDFEKAVGREVRKTALTVCAVMFVGQIVVSYLFVNGIVSF